MEFKGKLLSKEEETELLIKIKNGDEIAKSTFVEANYGLVIKWAKTYKNPNIDLEDLISYGFIGLMEAINNFDIAQGFKFSTYAVPLIRGAILKALKENSMITISDYQWKKIVELDKIEYILLLELNREPTDEEIAEKMNISLTELSRIKDISQPLVSLDSQTYDDGNSSIADKVADTINLTPEERLEKSHEDTNNKQLIEFALSSLTEAEKSVYLQRYDNDNKKSFEKIGRDLNVGRERVRTINKKIKEKFENIPTREEIEVIMEEKKKQNNILKEILEEEKKKIDATAKGEKRAMYYNSDELIIHDVEKLKKRYDDTYKQATDNKKEFAKFFKSLCEDYGRNVTKTTFNEATGTGINHLTNLKNGRSEPSMKTVVSFGIYFNFDSSIIRDLLDRGGYKFSTTHPAHAAYEFLLAYCSGYPIKYCNKVLEYLGIEEKYWLQTKETK